MSLGIKRHWGSDVTEGQVSQGSSVWGQVSQGSDVTIFLGVRDQRSNVWGSNEVQPPDSITYIGGINVESIKGESNYVYIPLTNNLKF